MLEQDRENIREYLYLTSYRVIIFAGGILIILFSLLFYFFIKNYGDFYKIPAGIREILIISGIFAIAVIGFYKILLLRRERKFDSAKTILNIVLNIVGKPMLKSLIVIGVLILYFASYFY